VIVDGPGRKGRSVCCDSDSLGLAALAAAEEEEEEEECVAPHSEECA
jgi:hypothetical protein